MSLVENKDIGFYVLLDSACKAPKPDVEAFMQELFKRHSKNHAIKIEKEPGAGNARGGPKKGSKKKKKRYIKRKIYWFYNISFC